LLNTPPPPRVRLGINTSHYFGIPRILGQDYCFLPPALRKGHKGLRAQYQSSLVDLGLKEAFDFIQKEAYFFFGY